MRSIRGSFSHFGVIILALVFPNLAQAQTPDPLPTPAASSPTLESQFFKNILSDQKAIWSAPFHLQRRDARWLAPIGFGTAALIATDRRSGDELAESRRQLQISRIVSYGGSVYGVAAVTGAFYFAGRATHNERARETGILGAEALLDSGILVTVIKEVTQRRRPTATRGRSDFFDGGSSFPSGHSIEAWSLATVIANEYHDHPAVQIAAYGIASAVSISRFTGEKHYLSDILVGSAMGYGIGRYVYRAHHINPSSAVSEEESLKRAHRWPMIAPDYNRRAREYGVSLAWSF